jgi:ApbE superfamily uncharacterized protein (UPF0280 family)
LAYEERTYRNYVKADDLVKFEVIEKETDLLILAEQNLYDKALAFTLKYRIDLETYILTDHKFLETLTPHRVQYSAPPIARAMADAARKAKVGPMAAVAGAMAEFVGRDLRQFTDEIIVENGGDIFLKINRPRKVGVFAGPSPFSGKIALEVDPRPEPFSVCQTEAVVIIAKSAPLAAAAATAIVNEVKEIADIEKGLKLAKKIRGLDGVLIIKGDQMGALGKVKIVPL